MRVNYAYDKYNQGQIAGTVKGVPRNKYSFTASLDTKDGIVELDKIASITMPGWSSAAMTMNSYNRKKVVQTNFDYSPITVVAYDTRDPAFIETFLKKYSNYYFAGPMNSEDRLDHLNKPKGFKLQADRNYIRELTIYRSGSKTDLNTISVYNPYVTNIDADTLDYSDSQLVQYRLTFMYEGYDIVSTNSGQ